MHVLPFHAAKTKDSFVMTPETDNLLNNSFIDLSIIQMKPDRNEALVYKSRVLHKALKTST